VEKAIEPVTSGNARLINRGMAEVPGEWPARLDHRPREVLTTATLPRGEKPTRRCRCRTVAKF